MSKIVAPQIESYLASLNRLSDDVLASVAAQGAVKNLPLIDAEVGAFLHVLARAVGARRILEIGTAIGYSGIWLARALPADGLLLTIEIDQQRAELARENFRKAGVSERANVMVGNAAHLLHKVAGPFDFMFQDGDKLQYEPLLDRLVNLLRPGGVLVTDNVLWDGEVVPGFVDPPVRRDEDTRAIANYNQRLASHPRLITTTVPLRDGLTIAMRTA